VAQKLRMTRQVHERIFSLIHEKGQPFTQGSQLQDFFVAQGARPEVVSAALSSVDAKFALTSYDTQTQLAGIRGVPSLLVNGRYLLSPGGKSAAQLAQLISSLLTLPG
jgi:protein dithiol oxidoreductase (disulfide-forming)